MEKFRDSDGFINLSNFSLDNTERENMYTLTYNNEKYYFKYIKQVRQIYNELIAYEIAKQLGINSIPYDLACYNGDVGVISKDYNSLGKVIHMSNILNNAYGIDSLEMDSNNLNDIWNALYITFKVESIVEKLMNEIIVLYLFDVIIGNVDRHDDNYALVINNSDIHVLSFDNQLMCDSNALYSNHFALGPYSDNKSLDYFFEVSDDRYIELFSKMLHVLDEDNIENILLKIENRIGVKMIPDIRASIKALLSFNRNKLSKLVDKIIGKKLLKQR